MKLTTVLVLILAVALSLGEGNRARAQSPATTDTLAIESDTTLVFNLVTGSRLYPDWSEEQTVRLHETFHIGDTEFMGAVRAFMPDFKIKDGEAVNWSAELNNPAAFIQVFNDSATVDSAWAFLNFPPHFSPNSFFTFRLKGIQGYGDPAARNEEK